MLNSISVYLMLGAIYCYLTRKTMYYEFVKEDIGQEHPRILLGILFVFWFPIFVLLSYRFLTQKEVKITRERQCWGCARNCKEGSTVAVVWKATLNGYTSTYWCKTCQEYCMEYTEKGEKGGLGELKKNHYEQWEEIREKIETVGDWYGTQGCRSSEK